MRVQGGGLALLLSILGEGVLSVILKLLRYLFFA